MIVAISCEQHWLLLEKQNSAVWKPDYRVMDCEFDASLCLLGEVPSRVALSKLHRPRVLPVEGKGKPLLITWYLENLQNEPRELWSHFRIMRTSRFLLGFKPVLNA